MECAGRTKVNPEKVSDPIKNWPEEERPRERLLRYGADSLSEAQLLAIILRTGVKEARRSALDLARALLSEFEGLRGIEQASPRELCRKIGRAHV